MINKTFTLLALAAAVIVLCADTVVPYSIVPVGYPAGDEQPKDKWDPARIHFGRW